MIKVKRLHRNAVIPKYAHSTDTGFDLFTATDTFIEPHSSAIARTGLAFELPLGWGVQIRPRSGISVKGCPCEVYEGEMTKEGIKVKTELENVAIHVILGTVDTNYRGEIGIIVYNNSNKVLSIPKGTKLAQGVLEKVHQLDFIEVEQLSDTDRGQEGFGSTGV